MTPQALALTTAVGPPDCASTALPCKVPMRTYLTTWGKRRTAKITEKRREPVRIGRPGVASRRGAPGRSGARTIRRLEIRSSPAEGKGMDRAGRFPKSPRPAHGALLVLAWLFAAAFVPDG